MGTTFSMGSCAISSLISQLKTAVLTSTDWSNPAGDRLAATTTRGADMVVDLSDGVIDAQGLTLGIYRTSGLSDKITRYLNWRTSGGLSSDTVHWTVSAGKEHLFISVEGPMISEPNPVDSLYGSFRDFLWLGDIVPYHASDTNAAVVCVANTSSALPGYTTAYVSRNIATTSTWAAARLLTLAVPKRGNSNTLIFSNVQRASAGDSKTYLWPWVIVESVDGLRGRMAKCFFAGLIKQTVTGEPVPSVYSKLAYGGETYILVPTTRSAGSFSYSPFGGPSDSSTNAEDNSVIAVPFS